MFFCNGCGNVLTKIHTIEDKDTKVVESRGMRLECKYLKDRLMYKWEKLPIELRYLVDAEITPEFEAYMIMMMDGKCPHWFDYKEKK